MSDTAKTSLTEATSAATSPKQNAEPQKDGGAVAQSKEQPQPTKEPNNNSTKKSKKRKAAGENKWQAHQAAKKKKDEPHLGSFAHPAMRQLFPDVQLPDQLLLQQGVEAATTPETSSADGENDKTTNTRPKRAKRKLAFLLGYLGTDFAGFQINEGQRTLQAEFELALAKCHMLDARNFGFPNKYGWSTSGRTDKGVHAAAQVCSAKVELLPDQTLDQVRTELNAVLPDSFQVLDVIRTTRSFCAKTQRDRVRYQYMIPSFLLMEASKIRDIFEKVGATNNGRHPADPLSPQHVAQIQQHVHDYRVTPEQLERLKTALQAFEGTKAHHNFTKGVRPNEARAMRYILSFRVEEPVVFPESGNMEWIPTQVLGQSFLLHQIRKMICMAVEVGRGVATVETIRRAQVKDDAIQVGLAPAQGLYLDMSYYGGYNERKNQQNPELPDADWTREDSAAYQRWKTFRNGKLMKHVVSEEESQGNFIKFLFVQEYFFDRDTAYDPEKRIVYKDDPPVSSEAADDSGAAAAKCYTNNSGSDK